MMSKLPDVGTEVEIASWPKTTFTVHRKERKFVILRNENTGFKLRMQRDEFLTELE